MHIRQATIGDKKELVRLIKIFETSDEYLSQMQRNIRAFKNLDEIAKETAEKYLTDSKHSIFVADDNGTLRGYISGLVKEKKHRIYDKEAYIENWFVEKELQNKGIGKKLFTAITDAFKKAGCTHISLDTHLEHTKAIQIYENMGFTKRLVTFFKPLKKVS